MTLHIYNTLTKKKELFNPIETGKVKIYVCGPTVYNVCHIGHARSSVFFDVIVKYLKNLNFEVFYVRNFTDIDDKIIQKSKKLGITHKELSEKYIASFHDDMKILNVDIADAEPRVTNHIKDIIDIIQVLIKINSAYIINGDVYFSVDSFNSYGKLSGRNTVSMTAGSRIKVNKNKKNPLDFALWKSSKVDEPSWESPWGYGRPGWHIECSAMNKKLMGKTIDIHGGGEDLIFPHHENEIAQSESAHGSSLARYWIHNGLVNINNEKMSKSLGNWKTIKEITKLHHPETIRLFLLSKHYRSPINFSEESLISHEKALVKAYKTLQRAYDLIEFKKNKININSKVTLWNTFCNAMDDDFNTGKSIGILFNSIKQINKTIDKTSISSKEKDSTIIMKTINDINKIGKILGIFNEAPSDYLHWNKKTKVNIEKIEKLIQNREEAREKKNWNSADKIRDKLSSIGIKIKDTKNGTHWEMIK